MAAAAKHATEFKEAEVAYHNLADLRANVVDEDSETMGDVRCCPTARQRRQCEVLLDADQSRCAHEQQFDTEIND